MYMNQKRNWLRIRPIAWETLINTYPTPKTEKDGCHFFTRQKNVAYYAVANNGKWTPMAIVTINHHTFKHEHFIPDDHITLELESK